MTENGEAKRLISTEPTDRPNVLNCCTSIPNTVRPYVMWLKPVAGVSLAVLSAIFTALIGLCASMAMSYGARPFQLTFLVRVTLIIVICIIVCATQDQLIYKNVKQTTLLIGVGIARVFESLIYIALRHVPIGNVMAVYLGLFPLLCAIGGLVFLKEHFTICDAFGSVINVIGVFLISRPTFIFGDQALTNGTVSDEGVIDTTPVGAGNVTLGYVCVVLCALGHSSNFILPRTQALKEVSPNTMVFYGDIHVLLFSMIMIFILEADSWTVGFLSWNAIFAPVLLVALFSFICRYCALISLKFERATVASIIQLLAIPVSFILQVFITDISVVPYDVIGSSLVIFGSIMITCKTGWDRCKEVRKEGETM
ncbi:uncharacterized protein LOC144439771 [Glandiceps talaboti]